MQILLKDEDMNTFYNELPSLFKDIKANRIRKYTKDGIFKPNETDMKYITRLKEEGKNVVAIIENSMFYKNVKLDVTNYIYLSNDYVPNMTVKGLSIKALVINRTWDIESTGMIMINEINGNLIRVF